MRKFYVIILFLGFISNGFSEKKEPIDRCQTRSLKEKISLKDSRYETFFRTLLLMAHRQVHSIVETVNEEKASSTMIFEEWAEKNNAKLHSLKRGKDISSNFLTIIVKLLIFFI